MKPTTAFSHQCLIKCSPFSPNSPPFSSSLSSSLSSSSSSSVALRYVADSFNFARRDPGCRLEGSGTTASKPCNSEKGKQGFLLTSYSKGAPIVQVKAACSTAELNVCGKAALFGTCGWRRAPKIWFTNTELGLMSYCYLKAWHVNGLVKRIGTTSSSS